ncbi:MAG: PIN domain-containing protein [Propionibacteriaceae bacterium]|nr:PIN domain-containing protein [Propionibacteriaceae bacterium]MCB1282600.1 PIN domain-containing protein [Salinibacterium sp.]
MAFPAFLDTNVLYGAALADTLLRVAEAGAYRPHWSGDVLVELSRNLVRHAGLSLEKADRRIGQMEQAFPDASVTGYGGLVDGLRCDPKDRHVLAAAIHGGCQVIVTFNTRDFPPESVESFGIAIAHPQDFLLDQLDLYPRLVQDALQAQAATSQRPELSYSQVLARLRRAGVGAFVDEVQHRFGKRSDGAQGEGRRFLT